jgi:flagellar motor switch protein FliN/FliY
VNRSDPQLGLAEATARAIADVLIGAGVPDVETGKPGIVERGSNPLEILPMPAVISRVAYVGGVSGGNVFATTVKGANQIAAAMGAGNDPGDGELSDIAQSAFEEAANQMLSSAAGATAAVLGRTVEVGPPDTTVVTEAPDVTDVAAPHMTRVSLTVAGETCLFVQLIPQVFVMRMTAAFAEKDSLAFDGAVNGPAVAPTWVHDTRLRLDAELGTAHLTADEVLGLADGAVVVLDRAVDDPIELFVNGMRYGHGRLLLDDDEWAVVIEELTPLQAETDDKETAVVIEELTPPETETDARDPAVAFEELTPPEAETDGGEPAVASEVLGPPSAEAEATEAEATEAAVVADSSAQLAETDGQPTARDVDAVEEIAKDDADEQADDVAGGTEGSG